MVNSLSNTDFKFVADLVKARSGIVLNEDKMYLVESRLGQIARNFSCADLTELVSKVRSTSNDKIMSSITEAMTTNESLFFRDMKPFDRLREIMVPDLVKARGRTHSLRIWSAASSTGQEAYSIAITLKEMSNQYPGINFSILGTDLSNHALERAKAGEYTQFEVQRGLSAIMLAKYFEKKDSSFKIKDPTRRLVRFEKFNLLESPKRYGTFDIVFLRNVLIYFDIPTKKQVLSNIASVMAPDGYLVLGGTESTLGVTDRFVSDSNARGVYRVKSCDGIRKACSF